MKLNCSYEITRLVKTASTPHNFSRILQVCLQMYSEFPGCPIGSLMSYDIYINFKQPFSRADIGVFFVSRFTDLDYTFTPCVGSSTSPKREDLWHLLSHPKDKYFN